MKSLVFLICVTFCVLYVVAYPHSTTSPTINTRKRLLGTKECTWGPSYWCSNITNAKSCNAVKHCIQTVWEHKTLPPDNDNICQLCVKMVKQARDQLESNETQEELKEVFEGSCKLIPLNVISNECCKFADEFVPELVETLASQMNPQVVCATAGLCNNERIDKLLAEQQKQQEITQKPPQTALVKKPDQCEGCHVVVSKLQQKFNTMSRDQVLLGILEVCGQMSSFSDGCTNIVITYFDDIYTHLQNNLNADQVCLMAGVCTAQFHTHIENVEITPVGDMGRLNVQNKDDDLPCELCEQLVKHLRDLLVANTTEIEFQRVLEGLCSQTKSFKSECMSLVDQYYREIYGFLINELDANSVCVMVGVCTTNETHSHVPIGAVLPAETSEKLIKIMSSARPELIGTDESNSYKKKPSDTLKIIQVGSDVQIDHPELMQLPIERLMPVSLSLAGNTQLCTFCEYFLHYVQQAITTPKTEEKIKHIIDGACLKLPKSISQQCEQFVDVYGDAFVALMAQEIDPSQVCPLLSLCPAAGLQDVEILMHSKPQDKSNCPLCLFAVTQLEDMIKNQKTEERIRSALSNLCTHLPKNLASECDDFVHTYTNELIEMLVADMTPQEVCVYLKLCDDKSPKHSPALIHKSQGSIDDMTLTNEIPDNTIEGKIQDNQIQVSKPTGSPQCTICEFIMKQVEDELKDKTNEDEIKTLVHGICNHLPKTVSNECNNFVKKYGDMVIQLLIGVMDPEDICTALGLCNETMMKMREEVLDCAICETTVTALDHLLDNPKVDHRMEHVLKKACLALPLKHQQKCKGMIDAYGDSFFHMVSKFANSHAVCQKVGLCSNQLYRPAREVLVGANKCTWGPSYWCKDLASANECNVLSKCQREYWKGDAPQ